MVKDRIDQERKNIEEYFEDGNSFLEDIVEASDEEVTLVNDDIEKEDYGNSYTDWSCQSRRLLDIIIKCSKVCE